MCWFTTKPPKEKIAKKDIKVQKILYEKSNGELFSPCYPYQNWKVYKEGIKLKLSVKNIENCLYTIDEGYHSVKKIVIQNDNCFTEGRFGRLSNFMAKSALYRICNFIIPKGTKYYINIDNEIVSETIKFIGIQDSN